VPKTIGASAHAAAYAGEQDPARLRVAPPLRAESREEWRERMARKGAERRRMEAGLPRGQVVSEASAYDPEHDPTVAERRATRDEQIVAAYEADDQPSIQELGHRFDLSHEMVRRILHQQGVQLSPKGHHRTPSQAAPASVPAPPASAPAVVVPKPAPPASRPAAPNPDSRDRLAAVTAYVAGDSMAEIAARTHRSAGTVRGWLVDAGVQLRARGGYVLVPGRDEQIVAAFTGPEHPSTRDLAQRFGVGESRIGQILRDHGVSAAQPDRPRSPARRDPAPSVPAPLSTPAPDEPDAPTQDPAPVEPAAVEPLPPADAAPVSTTAPAPRTELTALLPDDVRRAIHDVVAGLMDAAAGLAGAAKGMARLEAYAALYLPATTAPKETLL